MQGLKDHEPQFASHGNDPPTALNSSDVPVSFNIGWRGKHAVYKLGGATLATFRWSPPTSVH
jgi:hypothetical protein